jgi:hypothetical protein
MTHQNVSPAPAATGNGARKSDQLASEIDSENTKSATAVKFHPLANLFPLMEGEEFDALVADIKANGQHYPIITYEGMILDGRNRYLAGIAARIKPEFVPGDHWIDDPATYVLSANVRRRHLTAEQRRELITKVIKAPPQRRRNFRHER